MHPRGMVLGALFVLALVGCTPAATPTTTSTKPTAATPTTAGTTAPPSSPTPTGAAATEPGQAATPAARSNESQPAGPVGTADWREEWDKTVAAAKKEGKVVVVGSLGDNHRTAAMTFQRAYPEIRVDFTGAVTRQHALKLLAERRAGQYRSDVLLGAAMEVYDGLVPGGAFDPLRPALLLPEVLEDSKWHGGFQDGWGDKDRRYVYLPLGFLAFSALVNRDFVPESELNSLDQLLDPKWAGKIVTLDPRRGGPAAASLQALLIGKGEDFVRKLLAQDLVIKREEELAEAIVRGRYPISIGFQSQPLRFAQGLSKSIKPLAQDELGGSVLGGGGGSVMLANRAPHPNAARLYVNWVLSQEGQKAWVQATGYNSRRLDVEGPPDTAPDVRIRYVRPDREEAVPYYWRAMAIAEGILQR